MRALPLALLLTLAASAQDAADPWPAIRADRIARLLPQAMDRAEVDAWLVVCRENDNDPMARHVGCENAGGEAAVLFLRTGRGVSSVAVSPSGEATALAELGTHDEVVEIPRGEPVWPSVLARLRRHAPVAIAINRGTTPISDGLSSTQYERMQAGLGPDWMPFTTSAERLIAEWLAVKTPAEVEILRRAAALTAQWQEEAYAAAIPGVTTDRDIADFLEAKMAEAGVGDGWAPDQNPAVNSGRDRGHSHPTDRVIQPGDFIRTDFGIRVGELVTDIQRFAYVLGPGETEPPADALEKWEAAKRGSRAAFAAMRPGARGVDVDRAQRAVMRENGSLPVMWSTGHPVGYWAHDSGPSLGGGQEGRTPSGRQLDVLRPGMTFAFDGFHAWPLDGDDTKTISVEEMVVITETGAEWLTPPQEDLILIPSR
ncbi:M24 family metallopeptidase [Rubrivirga sp.]|uniref:M24 family metallopeptidase n=1 Tax=Rubrivirga sp. TaxID=1885344 RepID=UPI003B527F25